MGYPLESSESECLNYSTCFVAQEELAVDINLRAGMLQVSILNVPAIGTVVVRSFKRMHYSMPVTIGRNIMLSLLRHLVSTGQLPLA